MADIISYCSILSQKSRYHIKRFIIDIISRVQSREFERGHFDLISDENQTAQYFPIHVMLKIANSSFGKGLVDKKGPHGPSRLNTDITLFRHIIIII